MCGDRAAQCPAADYMGRVMRVHWAAFQREEARQAVPRLQVGTLTPHTRNIAVGCADVTVASSRTHARSWARDRARTSARGWLSGGGS
jgi:hypothetical protein